MNKFQEYGNLLVIYLHDNSHLHRFRRKEGILQGALNHLHDNELFVIDDKNLCHFPTSIIK